MTISLRVPACTAVSSAKAEILDAVSSSVMCPVKSGLLITNMLKQVRHHCEDELGERAALSGARVNVAGFV